VDVAEPPRIVFESSARCPDGHRAEELFRALLARSRAPGKAWVVSMRIDATGAGALHGEGEITDDVGAAVGHRAFTGKPGDCGGLASAVGIWASLVLDAELTRPHTIAAAATDEQAAAGRELGDKVESGASQPDRPNEPTPPSPPADPPPATDWPSGASAAEKSLKREDGHTLELGATGFVMWGAGGGAVAGASPFLLIEVAKGVFVRPSIAIGETLPSAEPAITWAVTRADGCLRMAGLYTNLQGMQLDLCGGVDAGMVDVHGKALPYLAMGPSMDLRGELGGDLAVTLRGLFGVNAVHEDSLDTPLWAGRGELALSWRLQ
jgi:hypothetical protein